MPKEAMRRARGSRQSFQWGQELQSITRVGTLTCPACHSRFSVPEAGLVRILEAQAFANNTVVVRDQPGSGTKRKAMYRPHCCPICNDLSVKTTLEEYEVTANVKGEDRKVNALATFTCAEGHTFLRKSDLVIEEPATRLTEGA